MTKVYEDNPDGSLKTINPTIDYFRQEVVRFRELMGSKAFWEQPFEKRDRATYTLGLLYVCFEGTPEENEDVITLYTATIDEYYRRERMILFGPLTTRK